MNEFAIYLLYGMAYSTKSAIYLMHVDLIKNAEFQTEEMSCFANILWDKSTASW